MEVSSTRLNFKFLICLFEKGDLKSLQHAIKSDSKIPL